METIWFRKALGGMVWRPITWQGWIIAATWLFANSWYFARIDDLSHSGTDTLINYSPFFVVSTLIFLLIVRKTSGRRWS